MSAPTYTTTGLVAGQPEHVADIKAALDELKTLLTGGLDAANITDGGVGTAELAARAVTAAKMASGSATSGQVPTADGSGGVSFADVGVSTQGSFRAYRNAAVSLTTGSAITWNAEDFDVSGWFDTTTGRFTPRSAGYYQLIAVLTANATLTSGNYWVANIRKAGTLEVSGQTTFQGSTGTTPVSVATGLVAANGSSDYFDVIASHNEGSGVALDITRTHSFFCGYLVAGS